MANVKVLNMAGAEVGTIELNDAVFAVEVSSGVLHAAVRAYLLNQRQGTQSTLTRSEVSGGGKKPWRQKGTGRARQGSTRSPQWTHGGVALGPKPRTYRTDLNKKVRRLALLGALSGRLLKTTSKLSTRLLLRNIKQELWRTCSKQLMPAKKLLSSLLKRMIWLSAAAAISPVLRQLTPTLLTYTTFSTATQS